MTTGWPLVGNVEKITLLAQVDPDGWQGAVQWLSQRWKFFFVNLLVPLFLPKYVPK